MRWAKNLSEAILLQSLEDLYSKEHRTEALRFFNGEGFSICASIIGLTQKESHEIFYIVKNSKALDTIKQFASSHRRHRITHIPFISPPHNLRHETVCRA